MTEYDRTLARIAGRTVPTERLRPSTAPHAHRWLPAGLTNSGSQLVQSCECGAVRKVVVPS